MEPTPEPPSRRQARRSRKACAVCAADNIRLTKHHVYPLSLAEVWRGSEEQRFLFVCRPCHDAIHYRGGSRKARQRGHLDVFARLRHPEYATVFSEMRGIIRNLSRRSRALHRGCEARQ